MNKKALSFAYLAVIILSVIFSIGSYLLFSELIGSNVNEDISRSLSLTLDLNNVAVTGVNDRRIDTLEDNFEITAELGSKGYDVPYDEILISFDINGDMYTYTYGGVMNSSTYTVTPILVSKRDDILRPGDKVLFKVPSPTTFIGQERVTLEVRQINSNSELRMFLEIPNNLYGGYQILR